MPDLNYWTIDTSMWKIRLSLEDAHAELPAIDALILDFLDVEEKRVIMVPIQITHSERHSDSEAAFFSKWAQWTKDLEVQLVTFLWVKADRRQDEIVEERKMDLRSNEKIVNPTYIRSRVAFSDIDKELGSRWVNLERNKTQYAMPALPTTSATSVPPALQSAIPVL